MTQPERLTRETVLGLVGAHGSFAAAAAATAAAAAITVIEAMLAETSRDDEPQVNNLGMYCRCVLKPLLVELLVELIANKPDEPLECLTNFCQSKALSQSPRCAYKIHQQDGLSVDLAARMSVLEKDLLAATKQLEEIRRSSAVSVTIDRRRNSLSSSDSLDSFDPSLPDIRFRSPPGFRSKMRRGVSSGTSGDWASLVAPPTTLPKHSKSAKEREMVKRFLLDLPFLFSTLIDEQLDTVIDAITVQDFPKGTTIVSQGDEGHELFIIRRGEVEVAMDVPWDTQPSIIGTLAKGDCFGELALLYNTSRAASIVALTKVSTYTLDRLTFCQIVRAAAYERRTHYEQLLDRVPLLTDLDKYQKAKIADALQSTTYKDGEVVTRQGEEGTRFFIVSSGQAIAMKAFVPGQPARCVSTYSAGDYFGEVSLLRSKACSSTIKAKGALTVESLDRKSFCRLLGPLEQILTGDVQPS